VVLCAHGGFFFGSVWLVLSLWAQIWLIRFFSCHFSWGWVLASFSARSCLQSSFLRGWFCLVLLLRSSRVFSLALLDVQGLMYAQIGILLVGVGVFLFLISEGVLGQSFEVLAKGVRCLQEMAL
jgi:hypothetical protein